MDGGRRLPGSLREWFAPRLDAQVQAAADDRLSSRKAFLAFRRGGFRIGSASLFVRRGMGSAAALTFIGLMGLSGFVIGGHYEVMRRVHGSLSDIVARAAGFSIRSVDVAGVKELSKDEILAASGITPAGSLLFLDVAMVRTSLKALPLVAEATVRKLYPDRVDIRIVEREPFALWQQEGAVSVVSADGTVIDSLTDARYLKLPHVVGPGARLRVREYAKILDGVPELRNQIRAGVLVSERRWTLKMANGVDIKLPEEKPVEALRQLARLDREAQVLSKDIIAVDLRIAGRIAFRLSEEAAAARRDYFEKTLPKVRGRA
jgi:cell division protein FtsQ